MTARVRFTQAELVRAIEAVQKAGLMVGGAKIEPDGTIVVLTTTVEQGAIPANDRANPMDRVLQ
jgi:hypothetical protein